nr:hypothetical protein [Tanacetum cinerariifolium]
MQTQTSNTLHNAIMEAGGKDRPPMLASGNYVQWKSRIKRHIDTKPNHKLIHYCLKNPPYKYQQADKDVPVAEGSTEITTERYMENYKNVSQDIRDQLNAEAKAVQIIITGIDNDIYSTVNACPNACEMWKAIERLKQGESINVQDLETNLYWEFEKFTSQDGELLESYYSRFYKMMNELVRNQCDVTNHQVNVQFLLQLEWQSLRRVIPTNYDPKGERFLIASRFPTPLLACAFFIPRATAKDCCCSKRNVEDKILVPKTPKNYARCARCGYPVDGLYCQGCTFLRKKLEEDLVTRFQGFQNTFESFDDSTNVINAPREPFCKDVLGYGEACQRCTCKRCGSGLSKGLCLICRNNQNSLNDSLSISANSSHNPPHIDECCYDCGDALDGIFCQRCACKSCGKGAHIGHNCPPKVLIISNPEPCNQTMDNEPPQTLPSFDPMCYSEKENSSPCVSKPNSVEESPNVFNPPLQPPIYSCKFCGSNAQYGHYCTPQVLLIYPEPGYSQDFNSSQNFHDFQQQYIYCDQRFDQIQSPQFSIIHQPPQETSIEILHDQEKVIKSVQTFLRKFNRYSFFKTPKVLLLAWDRVFKIKDAFGNEQYKPEDIQELFHKLLNDVQNIHEELAEYINTPGWNRPTFYNNDDDDDVDYTIAITPVLSTKEPDNSLSIGDEHLDTIPATESDEVIKSSVEDLVPIPSESEGIPDTIDDDSLYYENIEYVEASPHDSELVSLEVEKIVIPEDEEIKDDNLREKLLKVNLLIAKIKALKDNPTPSSEFLSKSSSKSPKPFLEGTDTFDNSLPEFENFYFDLEEISSGSTTTHSDISLSDYKAFSFSDDHIEEISSGSTTTHSDISLPDYKAFSFYDDHIEEISSGTTTTHSDISLPEYDSFIFDLSNDQFPPTDMSDFTHEEFDNEPAHIISPSEYDCFYFRNSLDPNEWISSLNFRIHENLSSTTRVNLPVEDDHSPLLAYVVWIFLAYLTYPVIPPHLHSFGNEDTLFDPGITINHFYSFKPGLSHRCGTFKKFNTHRSHLNESSMEMLFSILFPMDQ